jgi:HSP20 family protein
MLTPWREFGRLSGLSDEIDRLFDTPLAGLAGNGQTLTTWTPALDVYEEKDDFVVEVELPGMKKEEISLSFQDGTLRISGERKSDSKREDKALYRSERFHGKFERVVTLSTAIAADKVKAQYKDGVLTVTLPKAEEAKPKQIQVAVG